MEHNVERLNSENKLFRHMAEDILDGNGWEGVCSVHFTDQVINELKSEYVGLTMSVVQRFGSCFSQEVSEPRHFTRENVRAWEGRCE